MSKRKDKAAKAADRAPVTVEDSVQDLLHTAFTLAATTSSATVQAKKARFELSDTMLRAARVAGSAQALEQEFERFSNWLITAEGIAFQKQAGVTPALAKSGAPKLPSSFIQYKSNLLRYAKGADAGLLPKLTDTDSEGKLVIQSESAARKVMAAKAAELQALKLASRKLTDEERQAAEHDIKIKAERDRVLDTLIERLKSLSGDRMEQSLAIISKASADLLPLVQAERQAAADAKQAAEAASKAKAEALDSLPGKTLDEVAAEVAADTGLHVEAK